MSFTNKDEYKAMQQELSELESRMERTPNIELHEKIEALKKDLKSSRPHYTTPQ